MGAEERELASKFKWLLDGQSFAEVKKSPNVLTAVARVRTILARAGFLDVDAALREADIRLDALEAQVKARQAELEAVPTWEKVGTGIHGDKAGLDDFFTATTMADYCKKVLEPEDVAQILGQNSADFFDFAQNLLAEKAVGKVNVHHFLVQYLVKTGFVVNGTDPESIPTPFPWAQLKAEKETRDLQKLGRGEIAREIKKWNGKKVSSTREELKSALTNYVEGQPLAPIHLAAVLSHVFFQECLEILKCTDWNSALTFARQALEEMKTMRRLTLADLRICPPQNFPPEEAVLRNTIAASLTT